MKLPVRVEPTQEYGGDIRNMSGHWENGYWSDRFDVVDADEKYLCRCKDEDVANQIVEAINSFQKKNPND